MNNERSYESKGSYFMTVRMLVVRMLVVCVHGAAGVNHLLGRVISAPVVAMNDAICWILIVSKIVSAYDDPTVSAQVNKAADTRLK